MGNTYIFKRLKIRDTENELTRILHQMGGGDDSKETWKRYCDLMGIKGTEEELEMKRQETFDKEMKSTYWFEKRSDE